MTISLYYGDEEYLLQQAVKSLRQSVINPQMGSLGHKVLVNPDIGEVLEAVGAVCFNLGGKTLIELQDFPFLHKAASDSADERQLAELMELLENHDEGKHILFVNAKVNKTVKFAKWLTGHKTLKPDIKECKTLAFWQTDEAMQHVMQACRQQSIQIDPKAAALLIEHLGVSILPLMTEVEKLSIYAAGRAITVQDVNTLSNHNENTFQMLSDWLHRKNRAEVFQTLDEILLRQHPVPIFALIQGWLGNIYRMRYLSQRGISPAEIAQQLNKKPFSIQKDMQKYGSVPFERINTLRAQALDLEWKAKTGDLNPKLALEILLGA